MKAEVFPCFISFSRGPDTNFIVKFNDVVKRSPLRENFDTDTPALGQEACSGLSERRHHNERGSQLTKCLGLSVSSEALSGAGK